jgi:alkaline phosphatase D
MANDECRFNTRVFIRHLAFDIRHALAVVLAFATTTLAEPPPLPKEVTRIAFGSCLRQDRPAPILDAIADAKPDVFIWLGDNIYGDSDDPAVIKAKYQLLADKPAFQKLRETVPFLYVWDDHDYGKNDAGAEYAFKDQNKQIMLDFFGEPKDSARRKREGNYDSVIIGPEGRRVQFLLLDTRSFRSPLKSETRDKKKWYVPNDDPDATVLGEAQWKWLEEELKKPADVRIVCSSIQVLATKHRFEKWANHPKERERLINLLKPKAWSTLIISGDRHAGYVLSDKDSGLAEITASSLNQGGTPTPEDLAEPTNVDKPIGGVNYGLINITWKADGDPVIWRGLCTPDQAGLITHMRGTAAFPATQPSP